MAGDAPGLAGPLADGIVLRVETADDRGFARALYATQRADELAMTGWDAAQKDAFVDHQFAAQQSHLRVARPNADYLIVMRHDVAIGRLYVDRTVDPWRLAELALMPDVAGRGIGRSLVYWLLARAVLEGASGVDLHVVTDNVRGAKFYERLGFSDAPSAFASHRRLICSIS